MAGLVPAIHDFSFKPQDVDARDKPGHDGTLDGAEYHYGLLGSNRFSSPFQHSA
jgi:hypothetical protein